MLRARKKALPLLALAALLAALALPACGSESKDVDEGQPVSLGELQYNVIFSRFLNPNDNEDAAYLVGKEEAPPDAAYFGIFLEVQNESDEGQQLPAELTVEDSDGEEFEALESESLFAFPFDGEVEAQEQIPVLDSTAQQGAIEGSLVLFLLPTSATENRPLILGIPGEEDSAEVKLDL